MPISCQIRHVTPGPCSAFSNWNKCGGLLFRSPFKKELTSQLQGKKLPASSHNITGCTLAFKPRPWFSWESFSHCSGAMGHFCLTQDSFAGNLGSRATNWVGRNVVRSELWSEALLISLLYFSFPSCQLCIMVLKTFFGPVLLLPSLIVISGKPHRKLINCFTPDSTSWAASQKTQWKNLVPCFFFFIYFY